jgi:hypothetical protein
MKRWYRGSGIRSELTESHRNSPISEGSEPNLVLQNFEYSQESNWKPTEILPVQLGSNFFRNWIPKPWGLPPPNPPFDATPPSECHALPNPNPPVIKPLPCVCRQSVTRHYRRSSLPSLPYLLRSSVITSASATPFQSPAAADHEEDEEHCLRCCKFSARATQ